MWPLNRYPTLVAKGEDFVRVHGGKSIAIGRFVPGVKAVVPGIVGMLGMSQPYFLVVNISSGIVWALAHIFPGMLLGQGLALAGDLSGQLLVVLLVLLFALGMGSWLIRLLVGTLRPYTHAALFRLAAYARTKKSRSWQRFGKAIRPGNPRAPALILMFLLGVASLIALIDIVSGFMLRQAASNLDVSVATLMNELRNAPADDFMIPVTMLSDRMVIWALSIAVAGWLFIWRGWRVALLLLAMLGLAQAASTALNPIVSGPQGILHGGLASSPTLLAGLTFGSIAVLASHAMGRWSKAVVAGICGSIVVAIAFSRVYLGAEWLSSVLAGGLLAFILTSLFGMAIEAIPARRIRPLGLMGFAAMVLLVAGSMHIDKDLPGAETQYAKRNMMQTFSGDTFAAGDWQKLASRRIDLAGKPEEVFTAQWVGNLDPLKAALSAQGWTPLKQWRWHDAFSYLDSKAPLDKLPPRPVLHRGLKAKLTMTLVEPGNAQRRLVLRAFKAYVDVAVDGRTEPVFLISVTPETPRSRFHLYAMPSTQPSGDKDKQLALAALNGINGVTVLAQTEDPFQPARVLLAKP
jgi:membrane-associated phospholipid phosphatase